MKLLHTADWHLGKKLESFSRMPEQQEVLAEIIDIAEREKVDLVLLAGDLYDSPNPPIEAVELLYKTLKDLNRRLDCPIIAIAGNHDSPDRIEAPDPLARACGIFFAGYPGTCLPLTEGEGFRMTESQPGFVRLQFDKYDYAINLIHSAYANELRLKTVFPADSDKENYFRETMKNHWNSLAENYMSEKDVNLLMTHLFFLPPKGEASYKEPENEKPVQYVGGAQAIPASAIPKRVQYTALGHLHRCFDVNENSDLEPLCYSGSPLAYSMAEAGQKKYVQIVELKPGTKASVKKVVLQSGRELIRKKFTDPGELLPWLAENKNALVELHYQSEHFLSAEQTQSIRKAHDGILKIIPYATQNTLNNDDGVQEHFEQSMEELFFSFFRENNDGVNPDKAILNLFKEIVSEGEE